MLLLLGFKTHHRRLGLAHPDKDKPSWGAVPPAPHSSPGAAAASLGNLENTNIQTSLWGMGLELEPSSISLLSDISDSSDISESESSFSSRIRSVDYCPQNRCGVNIMTGIY